MIRFLILGAGSYIGTYFQTYLQENYGGESVCESASLRTDAWREADWSVYDCILNVTGRAHADIGSVTQQERESYYQVNCALAVEAAQKAIADGAGQYIYPSSIIVYGDSSSESVMRITSDSRPAPSNFYGDSKWQAEQGLMQLFPEWHKGGTALVVARLPMIYGNNSRGNYRMLERMARKLPFFPKYDNARSMLYIENLCEFLWLAARGRASGLYFPQNAEYVQTSHMVAAIGEAMGKKVRLTKLLGPAVALSLRMPGKIGGMARKAFGSLTYEKDMSILEAGDYCRYTLEESIRRMYEHTMDAKRDNRGGNL